MDPTSSSFSGSDVVDVALEVTVLSAESLKSPSSLFLAPGHLRPYVALSAPGSHLLTRVDEAGSHNPTWGDTLLLPLAPSFLHAALHPSKNDVEAAPQVHVSVLSRGRFAGSTQLGWCSIPAADFLDGLRPPGARRRLSYALRCPRYGGRGHGVVHVAVRVVGPGVDRLAAAVVQQQQQQEEAQPGWHRLAIGIPVSWGPEVAGGAAGAT